MKLTMWIKLMRKIIEIQMKLMRPNIAMLLETGEEATVRMQIGMGRVYECNLKKKKNPSFHMEKMCTVSLFC